MGKKILLATDFSGFAREAEAYAADLARLYSGSVHVLHVITDIALSADWYTGPLILDEIYDAMRAEATKEMEKIKAGPLSGAGPLTMLVKVGHPASDIVSYAMEQGIDIIIVGTHGRTGIDRALFGSTALQIIKHAPCTVLTVKAHKP